MTSRGTAKDVLTVQDLVAVLRWANVAANRGMKKVQLLQRWTVALLDGGPPSLTSKDELKMFPEVVPQSWMEWRSRHVEWQGTQLELLNQTTGIQPTDLSATSGEPAVREGLTQAHESLPMDLNETWSLPARTSDNAAQPTHPPTLLNSKELFFVFDTRVLRRRGHLALGTAEKLCVANEFTYGFLPHFPITHEAATAFKKTPRSKVVLWIVLQSLQETVSESKRLMDWYLPGDSLHDVAQAISSECRTIGIEPTLKHFMQNKILLPIPLHRVARTVNLTEFLTTTKPAHARVISRKRTKLIKALQDYVEVAQGTCALVHINGKQPKQSFVRVQRPQEQYYATGDAFDAIAHEVQRRFDHPRDAKAVLVSLQLLPFHGLMHETRLLVAEVSNGTPDWTNRPVWLKPDISWSDPNAMSSTDMLKICHACLEAIFCPDFCGPVRFENGRVFFQDKVQ